MKKETEYEWDVETLDEHGDIVDHHFQAAKPTILPTATIAPVLVKSVWGTVEGEIDLIDRTWAYMEEDGSMPMEFEDGSKVPTRFL